MADSGSVLFNFARTGLVWVDPSEDEDATLEAALDAGRPRDIRVTDLQEQVIEEKWVREGVAEQLHGDELTEVSGPAPTTAVVAVVVGDGIGRIFRSLGVRTQVRGGQSMNPSTAELVEAVRATGSQQVIILPNNKNIRPVAEQINDLVDIEVRVVPTNSIVEGFAALLAYDPGASVDDNVAGMDDSASAVIAGEVTQAVRDTESPAGMVRVGDWIGLTGTGIVSIADSVAIATTKMIAAVMTEQHELITLIEGDSASAANTRRITEYLHEEYPDVAVEVHHGGQPLYPYLVGIE